MELVYQSAAFVLCHSLSDKYVASPHGSALKGCSALLHRCCCTAYRVRFQHRSQLIMDDIAEECTGFEEKETDSLKSMINAGCRVFVIS